MARVGFINISTRGHRVHSGWSDAGGFWSQREFTAEERAAMVKGNAYFVPMVDLLPPHRMLVEAGNYTLPLRISVGVEWAS